MTDGTARWQSVRALFEQALSLPTGEREALLAHRCPADEGLRGEVQALLLAHSRAESAGFLARTPAADEHEAVGGRVGAYRILRPLGNGGMGAVYLAVRDDDSYQQRVALKVVRPGAPDPTLASRFRGERQILAVLEHPNIARLLDGGSTSEGLPYLVMEYVEGLPLDEYCQRHDLSVADRLRLFGSVCAAVHYAHQNLVVHRDLKPRNILVTSKGVPKLLDFGIAKLLNPAMMMASPEVTDPSARPCTPEYASPEQLHGEPISTASDIYALGVLLYRLLTDARPQPQLPRPSDVTRGARRRLLRGDLDTIVRMATHLTPQRRYPSAEQLKEDIDRHLQGRPVRARADSLSYRSLKFLGRNRLSLSAAVLGLLVLLGAVVTTAWQARSARSAAQLLERRNEELDRRGQALQRQLAAAQVQLQQLQQRGTAVCPPAPKPPAPKLVVRRPPAGHLDPGPLRQPQPMNQPMALNQPEWQGQPMNQPQWQGQPMNQPMQMQPMNQPMQMQQRPFRQGVRQGGPFFYKPRLVAYPMQQHDIRSYAPAGEGPLAGDRP